MFSLFAHLLWAHSFKKIYLPTHDDIYDHLSNHPSQVHYIIKTRIFWLKHKSTNLKLVFVFLHTTFTWYKLCNGEERVKENWKYWTLRWCMLKLLFRHYIISSSINTYKMYWIFVCYRVNVLKVLWYMKKYIRH